MQASIDAFYFEAASLDAIARARHDEYVAAQPFPHAVLHDLVPRAVLDDVIAEFPSPDTLEGTVKDKPYEKKRAYRDLDQFGPTTRHLIGELNSATFLRFLERLSGINGLLPDPHLTGGGLHLVEPGGYLGVHADFNVLGPTRLDRRLNLLIYLNDDWDESWGGHLELWERDMSACVERIAPTLGTTVVFSTLSDSYHGHPEPLACPPGRARRSLALYYYSNGRPAEEAHDRHSTLWQRRPDEGTSWGWRRWIPPAAIDLRRRLGRTRRSRS